MKTMAGVLALALVSAAPAVAGNPDWAYPVTPRPEPHHDKTLKQAPGSAKKFTPVQIDDPFNPPDWFPDEHPKMPPVVARGRKPAVAACAHCHLPTGNGFPQSAGLAGLPATYIARQIAAFKNGERKGVRGAVMAAVARALTEDEVKSAADYYASLAPGLWSQVIEVDKVPASYIGPGGVRFALPDGVFEPVGERIIALPQNSERAVLRDPHSGFVAYVPRGSIARGKLLVDTGDAGRIVACARCHGPELRGQGDVPAIAGRLPSYTFRQLNDMQSGARAGAGAALMNPAVANLSQDDMVAIAAYLGALAP
jgi:cytochrome c553